MADIIINITGQASAATSAIDRVIDRLNALTSALSSVQSASASAFSNFGSVNTTGIESLRQSIDAISTRLEQMQASARDAFSEFSNANNAGINGMNQSIAETSSQMQQIVQVVATTQSGMSGAAIGAAAASGAVSSLGASTKRASSEFFGFTKNINKSTFGLGKLMKSIGRVLFYRAIRAALKAITQAFKEGLKNAYEFSKRTGGMLAPALDKMSSASAKMKNQLGAAFGGLITAITPILLNLIDLVTRAADAVTQLFAILNGSGVYKKATDQVTEWGDAAAGAGGKVKGLLAAWDELNVIGNESGGGGGGNNQDYGGMYEWVEVDDAWADLFNNGEFFKIGENVNNALGEISDTIAKWFRELDNMHFGKKFSDFVNGVFSDKTAFEKSGKAVGEGLNVIIHAWDEFVNGTNWKQVGTDWAAKVNGIFRTVDWESLGNAIGGHLTKMPSIIIGFIHEIDTASIGSAISTTLLAALENVTEWIQSQDWKEIGKEIETKINDFMSNIDFGGIASGAIKLLGEALVGSIELLFGFFSQLWEDIKKWWGDRSIGEVVSDIWEDLKTWWADSGLEEWFGGIWGRIVKLWDQTGIGPWLKDTWESIKNWFIIAHWNINIFAVKIEIAILKAVRSIATNVGHGIDGVVYGLKAAWWGIKTAFISVINWIIGKINKVIDTINSAIWAVGKLLGQDWGGIPRLTELTQESFEDAVKWSDETANAIWNHFSGTIEKLEDDIVEYQGHIDSINAEKAAKNVTKAVESIASKVSKTVPKALEDALKYADSWATKMKKAMSVNATVKVSYQEQSTGGGTGIGVKIAQAKAAGGYVNNGELFVARESGPELVGTVGNRTAVANNDQIVSGISSGVASANAEQNNLLEQLVSIGTALLRKDFTISPSAALGQVMARSSEMYARS